MLQQFYRAVALAATVQTPPPATTAISSLGTVGDLDEIIPSLNALF
jgi:hypothetical protein